MDSKNSANAGVDAAAVAVGESLRPLVADHDVRAILRRAYGLEPLKVRELLSYKDRNFLVTAARGSTEDTFVLKVLNPLDSADTERVARQVEVCSLLLSQAFSCPATVPATSGSLFFLESFPVGKGDYRLPCLVRLLTFVHGLTLGEVKLHTDLPPALMGALLAQMHSALQDCPSTSLEVRDGKPRALENTSMLPSLFTPSVGEERQHYIRQCLGQFEEIFRSTRQRLQTGVIHGDLCDYNLIILDKPPRRELATVALRDVRSVLGVIDFAEISHSFLVFDLALLLCDKMVSCSDSRTRLQGEASGHVLAGYLASRRLGNADLAILSAAVVAYLCVYHVDAEFQFHLQPDNPYTRQGSAEAWAQLERLRQEPPGFLEECWNSVLVKKHSLRPAFPSPRG